MCETQKDEKKEQASVYNFIYFSSAQLQASYG